MKKSIVIFMFVVRLLLSLFNRNILLFLNRDVRSLLTLFNAIDLTHFLGRVSRQLQGIGVLLPPSQWRGKS